MPPLTDAALEGVFTGGSLATVAAGKVDIVFASRGHREAAGRSLASPRGCGREQSSGRPGGGDHNLKSGRIRWRST